MEYRTGAAMASALHALDAPAGRAGPVAEPQEARAVSLAALRRAEAGCTRCPLYRHATQVVPGEGPRMAALMLVGEQPGDSEDRAGTPFVGPAGRMMDKALDAAGIPRGEVFVTNAVKHFKFEPRGKRRLHKKPNAYEIDRCRWWLGQELALVRPKVIVALGATAARSLTGRPVTVSAARRTPGTLGRAAFAVTVHPSFLLRLRDAADREREFARFVADLEQAWELAAAR